MLSRREMGALCASLLFCLLLSLGAGWAQSQLITADQLAADTLRLHIRADTDSVRDQSAKLAVRDAVLALTDEACPADSRADARAWAAESLVRFELTARQTLASLGIRAPVKACLVNMYFPTRRYDGGALPAGRYDAVRLDIGTRRAGRNWWCVLYPGLCRSACGGYDTPAENDLVCGEYIVRFRFVEWWGGLTAPREDVVLAG
jgi:stage II sporulation protein R